DGIRASQTGLGHPARQSEPAAVLSSDSPDGSKGEGFCKGFAVHEAGVFEDVDGFASRGEGAFLSAAAIFKAAAGADGDSGAGAADRGRECSQLIGGAGDYAAERNRCSAG